MTRDWPSEEGDHRKPVAQDLLLPAPLLSEDFTTLQNWTSNLDQYFNSEFWGRKFHTQIVTLPKFGFIPLYLVCQWLSKHVTA